MSSKKELRQQLRAAEAQAKNDLRQQQREAEAQGQLIADGRIKTGRLIAEGKTKVL